MKETIDTILDIEYKLKNLYPNETIETQLKHLQKDIKTIYKNLETNENN